MYGVSQGSEDTQQLVTVIVADAHGNGNRHDTAEQTGPEAVDELLVAVGKQNQLVTGLYSEVLKVMKNTQGTSMQISEADPAVVGLLVNVANVPIAAPVFQQGLHQGRRVIHADS